MVACPAASMRDVVLQHGVRADEAAPGSGSDSQSSVISSNFTKGHFSLEDSPMGGLHARLRVPT